MEKILNDIGGEPTPPRSGRFMENIEPARGKPFCLIPDSGPEDVEAAVQAARAAFPPWAATPVAERAHCLSRLADLIHQNLESLARDESRDTGKPVELTRTVDIPRSEQNFRFFAAAIQTFHGDAYTTDQRGINYTEYSPLGVVACISPWNLPLYLLTWKLAPALAAGNAVIAKPSEVTPLTAARLGRLARQAGLPPGVLNILHGTGPNVGGPLTTHPDVKAISFTGSTATGRRIAESTAGQFKKISLEMGGKNANVVFADADFETALATTVRSSFLNQGQICLCGSRILIERPIYERFKTALVEKARALRQGDPLMAGTEQGALVSQTHFAKVKECVARAVSEGGRVLCGGEAAPMTGDLTGGYFFPPTLIENLGPQAATNQEEIFGPVATLIPFETEAEAIAIANSTRYGLSASLWTRDITRAHRVARQLEAGLVWINTWMMRDLRTPFGGVKESGVGREGGLEALRFFTEVKNICVSLEGP